MSEPKLNDVFKISEPQHCERCGEKLNDKTSVWLELDTATGLYHEVGKCPPATSQGCFAFGRACARAVLAAGGFNKAIGRRAPLNRPTRRAK